jgi:hypothetical protein
MNTSLPAIVISNWKARASGSLVGFFTVQVPSGLVFNELMLHERNGQFWLSFPSKPMIGADGGVMRDENGKARYDAPLISFANWEAKERFTQLVIAALREAQPAVFAAEPVG